MFKNTKRRFSKAIPILFVLFCSPSMGFEITPPIPSDTEPRRISLRNQSGAGLSKGDLVAVTGFNVTEGRPTVDLADKDLAAFRPAMAVIEASVPNNTNFEGLVIGLLVGVDTSSFVVNAQLVLGDDGGVSTPPPDTDPFTGEVQMIGSVVRSDVTNGSIYFVLSSDLMPMTAAQFFWTKDTATTGFISGGDVTRVSGLDVAVTSGTGFANDGGTLFRITWSAVSNLTLTASDTNHIFVDSSGVVQNSVIIPDLESTVVLATAITGTATVDFLSNHSVPLEERAAKAHEYTQDVVGPIIVSGITTTLNATPLRLDVDLGTFYIRDFRATVPAGANPITFTYWFRDGSGGFTRVASRTVIDTVNFDDGDGTLGAIPAGQFKKDLLFVSPTSSGVVEYHVFYGQETFSSQSAAEAGNLPSADSDVLDNAIRSGGIVVLENAAVIASVVDVRPFLGQLSPSTTVVTDHGLLGGLADDDHTQYQLRSEKDQLSGYAGLDGSGDISLTAVPAHASTHTNGTDDIQDATSTVKGLATSTQISKLDGIESLATADQSDAEIKTAYENNANTNEFDDTEQSKLAGIETLATADQTDAEIKTAYENNADTNAFTDSEKTKLGTLPLAWFQFLGPENASLENFNGSPDIFAATWDATDFESFSQVSGTTAVDLGGYVFQFVVPQGATVLAEIECTGKAGVAGTPQINYRVKDEAAVQVATATITATVETDVTITTFSPSPGLTAGDRILVEAEGDVAIGEDVFIGSCRANFTR